MRRTDEHARTRRAVRPRVTAAHTRIFGQQQQVHLWQRPRQPIYYMKSASN